jgi:hypothetical protein
VLSLALTTLDSGKPQLSMMCGSKAGAVAPDDGGATNLAVGGDLAGSGFAEAQMPVKTALTSVRAEDGDIFALLPFSRHCCCSSRLLAEDAPMNASSGSLRSIAMPGAVLSYGALFLGQVLAGAAWFLTC